MFDMVLLEEALNKINIPIPWNYYNYRDTRTLYELANVSPDRSQGAAHHALDDVINQAKAVCRAYKKVGV